MGTVASRVRDFNRMNPLMFNCSKVVEDPVVEKVYQGSMIMRVTPQEKARFPLIN